MRDRRPIPPRARRKVLNALHAVLDGRSRCLTFKQMADFVNEHVPGWTAKVSTTSYTPQRKMFAHVSWFGREQQGSKLEITDKKGTVIESNTTDAYHRNSYTLMRILDEMGTGSGSTASTQDELGRYGWYNPFGISNMKRERG